jgi:hypothetical protein
MHRIFAFALLLVVGQGQAEAISTDVPPTHAVTIEVVADSGNHVRAQVRVPAGTSARDLMEKLFKMEYLDAGRKFVVGIAGFKASPREKQFWKLEVDGVASQVGIAEIAITRTTQLRWVVTSY